MPHKLVVARWNEDVAWACAYPHVIYDKGGAALDTTGLNVVKLDENPPHRESHTYLWHIINHYNDLDDFTTFCQGKPFEHASQWDSQWCVESDFAWIGHWMVQDNRFGWPHHPDTIPVGVVYEMIFNKPAPVLFEFVAGAQFVASRQKIQARPLEFYERLQALGYEPEFSIGIHERLWGYVLQGGA